MRSILALDQGTTSSRAVVFDPTSTPLSVAHSELNQVYSRPGWVEHRPHEILQSQIHVAREALSKAGLTAEDVAAIGITNQRETTLVWDRQTGEPIYNAIVWQDRRTADLCQRLKQGSEAETIHQKTGLLPDPYFSGTKLQWILDNVDGARSKAEKGDLLFGTVDTWLIWHLSSGNRHVTDASNASRTLLLNIHTGEWDDELLELFDIPRAMLPSVSPSSQIHGYTDVFGSRIPIAGIAGDQQAALFGQACHQSGMAKNTYGTGCFTLMHIGTSPTRSQHNLLTTIAWRLGDRIEYALEGSIFIAGAVVQWLRDGLGIIKSSGEIESLAGQVPDNGGVYFVPAFSGLGTPYWDPYARGTICGISRGTTAAHLARAALESIAFQVTDVLRTMDADSTTPIQQLRVDGGASGNTLLMQLQADLLRVPVLRSKIAETTAVGAAYLAGLAVGVWESRAEIARQWETDVEFHPKLDSKLVDERYGGWLKAVSRAKGWVEGEA